jgi:hypothetical protein
MALITERPKGRGLRDPKETVCEEAEAARLS